MPGLVQKQARVPDGRGRFAVPTWQPSSRKTGLITQPHGGAIRTGGNPGNRGGGRPPNEFKRKMRELATSEKAEKYLDRCLDGEFGPKFCMQAKAHVDEHGYRKATQFVETVDRTPRAPVNPDELRAIYSLVLGRGMTIPQAENYIRTNPEDVKAWLAKHSKS